MHNKYKNYEKMEVASSAGFFIVIWKKNYKDVKFQVNNLSHFVTSASLF